MKKAQDELTVADKEIRTLKPQLQLDTLCERSKDKKEYRDHTNFKHIIFADQVPIAASLVMNV